MRRVEFTKKLGERTSKAIESWAYRHAPKTYAGSFLEEEHGPVIFRIGFTGDQIAQLEAFKREVKLFAPAHIQSFPVPPTYTEQELEGLSEEVFESQTCCLFDSVWSNIEANKVEVGTQHVARAKRLLLERFGTLDPFLVVFEEPPVPL